MKEKQNATYTKVMEKILLKIQQSFEKASNVVDSLVEEKSMPPEEPERVETTVTDP